MHSRMTSRWSGLRTAYPRTLAGVVLGIALLLVTDLVLVYERLRYGRELARSSAAMVETERRRVAAIAASEENGLALAVELARREALGDTELHLAVDVQRSLLYLQREGARLREMRVRVGGPAAVGSPHAVVLAPPLGKRWVTHVVDASYPWIVPEWVYLDRGLPAPSDREIPEALGPLTVFLDGGAILYSLPAVGPLSDAGYVLPGSVRAEARDLDAIRENLTPGMAVYFH